MGDERCYACGRDVGNGGRLCAACVARQAQLPDDAGESEWSVWERDGFRFVGRLQPDEYPDLSYLDDDNWPDASDEERACNAERRAAYERGAWSVCDVIVTAHREGIELGFASCGGIETDSEPEYIRGMLCELADEAAEMARDALGRLCAGC